MDKVRLEVRDTSRNSEKLRPKANKPPTLRTRKECSSGASSVTRNSLSEVLRLRPGGGREETHAGNPQVCTKTLLESQNTREKLNKEPSSLSTTYSIKEDLTSGTGR